MHMQQAISNLFAQPLLLSASSVGALLRTADTLSDARLSPEAVPAKKSGHTYRSGRCMVVDISGIMMHRPGWFERGFLGAIDYAEIAEAIVMAGEDGQSDAVVLAMNTPGGTHAGISEVLAAIEAVAESAKPIAAVVNEQACSAGQWIASKCDAVLATPSSRLGSVGSVMVVLDSSSRYEAEGLRTVVIRSGELKAAGAFDGDPLTEEQHADLVQMVDRITKPFAQAVAKQSGMRVADVMGLHGRCLVATEAQELGFCDLVPSLGVAIDLIEDELASSQTR